MRWPLPVVGPLRGTRNQRRPSWGPPKARGGPPRETVLLPAWHSRPAWGCVRELDEAILRLSLPKVTWKGYRVNKLIFKLPLRLARSAKCFQRHARVEDFCLALCMLWVPACRDSLVGDSRSWRGKGRLASCSHAGLLV